MNGVVVPGTERSPLGRVTRDRAVTALILGIAAMSWFGWGQAEPPGSWKIPLMIGTFASIAVAGASGARAFRLRG